jgi:hypothetical protein
MLVLKFAIIHSALLALNYPVCFLGHFQSWLASKSCLIPIFGEEIELFSYLHAARDTANAEFKVRATFAVGLLSLALFKSMIFLHENIQLYIGHEEPALKTN